MIGSHTYNEILSQPEAWLEAAQYLESNQKLIEAINPKNYDEIIFTGCGSTYYLALAAATLLRETSDLCTKGLPASEIWLYPKSAYNASKNTLLIAVSRSGTTTETLRAVKTFKEKAKGTVITLSCYPDSPLASLGQLNLVLRSGQEQSIAQTRAFSVLYLACVSLTQLWSNHDLSFFPAIANVARTLLDQYDTLAKQIGTNAGLERFYFLGSGSRYGLACELSLKMKEMTLSHSEPFHFLEFRHGPQSMANEDTLIIGLISEQNSDSERAVLKEMEVRGAQIITLANDNADISFSLSLNETLCNVLFLPIMQLMAFERSISKGLNPDKPHNLSAVVILD